MRAKLSKTVVNNAKADAKEIIVWDSDVPGLGLRVTANGAKSYIAKYRIGTGRCAPLRKPTLGKVSDLSVEQARAMAREWKTLAKEGIDPARRREIEAKAPTISDLCDEYLKRHAVKKRSAGEDKRKIERRIKPKLGRLRVKDVRLQDIDDLHRSLRKTPYEANRNLALLSKMFSLAVQWGWRTDNPATGVEKYPEEKRDRYLTPKEVEALINALEEHVQKSRNKVLAQRSVDAIRLLVLTGARKGEVLRASWDQFDLDEGVWTKPSSHTKQKKRHRVPLSEAAITLMLEIKRRTNAPSSFVFPGHSNGHLGDIKSQWKDIKARAGLVDVRPHDLRHTFASLLVSGGASLPVIGALLGHTQAATTQRYAHLMDDPLREAAGRVGVIVAGAVDA